MLVVVWVVVAVVVTISPMLWNQSLKRVALPS